MRRGGRLPPRVGGGGTVRLGERAPPPPPKPAGTIVTAATALQDPAGSGAGEETERAGLKLQLECLASGGACIRKTRARARKPEVEGREG